MCVSLSFSLSLSLSVSLSLCLFLSLSLSLALSSLSLSLFFSLSTLLCTHDIHTPSPPHSLNPTHSHAPHLSLSLSLYTSLACMRSLTFALFLSRAHACCHSKYHKKTHSVNCVCTFSHVHTRAYTHRRHMPLSGIDTHMHSHFHAHTPSHIHIHIFTHTHTPTRLAADIAAPLRAIEWGKGPRACESHSCRFEFLGSVLYACSVCVCV